MQSHFERIGGAKQIHALVDRFYDLMDTLPESFALRQMHPQDLSSSRQKLYEFLSGWMGGPALFTEKYGHPMLKRRHLPFSINSMARDQWMLCMRLALDETVKDPALHNDLLAAFQKVADHMRNTTDAPLI